MPGASPYGRLMLLGWARGGWLEGKHTPLPSRDVKVGGVLDGVIVHSWVATMSPCAGLPSTVVQEAACRVGVSHSADFSLSHCSQRLPLNLRLCEAS